ncbi:MAG TPA: NUDIX domain-containing protein [Ramlibacter sp.]|nr:NUDIX domain-containing protein [Ramlibacter sp.]
MAAPAVPRHAATLVVARQGDSGVEVLLLQRADKQDQNSGAWVFPGGLVDAGDARSHALCNGMDDAAASTRLGVTQGGLDYYIAAIRECFEEAGLLFAVDGAGRLADAHGQAIARWDALRQPLHRGDVALVDACQQTGMRLAVDELHYIGHWVTPVGLPKRFDTRFFLAVVPPGQSSRHDTIETLDQVWIRPADALAPEHARRLLKVTREVLATIGAFADLEALLAWARSEREVPMVMQRRCRDSAGPRSIMPSEPAWPEIGLLDPEGEVTAWCELRPDIPVRLTPRVQRVTAAGPNGRNAYVVASASGACAVIDPSAQDSHVAALLEAAGGRIDWVLQTEPGEGAALLAARAGARTLDAGAIDLGPDVRLQVLRSDDADPQTLSYLLVEDRMLFGDAGRAHVDTAGHRIEWIAPAQGFLLPAS